jgi:hypothetical protein
MSKSRIIKICRWIGILPTAILSMVIATGLTNLIFGIQRWFVGASPDSGFAKISYWILSSLISAGAFVYFGSKMAPQNRKVVSFILASLIIAISGINVFTAFYTEDTIWKILASISSVFAAGYIVHGFYEDGEDFDFE